MNFRDELNQRTKEAQEAVLEFLPRAGKFDGELIEAMNYSVGAGGKRLRPLLMMSFNRLYGGDGISVRPFMAAMEMLHTYSLVHDDLPAIDNDDYRRGKYTTHKRFGEAAAILAGDGLLHCAHETALKAFALCKDRERVIRALLIFADKTGINGMLGGQAADVINTSKSIDRELMYYIYEKKTGALIEGSMMIGAALAGASDDDLETICRAGADIGTAFQIRDDILDVTGDESVIGKPKGSDERNGKTTYVSVNGLERAQEDADRLSAEARLLLSGFGVCAHEREFIGELFDYLCLRDK
ncbi:MAG: polyprenyl synthetase family protein [Butyrivibrio sp.]|nr:polyprenyl synthetase family protein [Butyrivibrio sp.]